jgi:hypothetical protein
MVQDAWQETQPQAFVAITLAAKLTGTARALTIWAEATFKNGRAYLKRSKMIIRLLDVTEENRPLTHTEFKLRIDL